MRNSLRREEFIKRFGEERFNKISETDSYYKKFKNPVIPKGCSWIFKHFLYIYFNAEHNGLTGTAIFTFRTLNEYEACMKVPLTIAEKKLLIKMNMWANEQIAEFDAQDNKENQAKI